MVPKSCTIRILGERIEQYCLHFYSILLVEKYFITDAILLTFSAKLPSESLALAPPRTRWCYSCGADALPLRGCGRLRASASRPAGGELGLPREASVGTRTCESLPAEEPRSATSADLAAVSPLGGMRAHAGKAERWGTPRRKGTLPLCSEGKFPNTAMFLVVSGPPSPSPQSASHSSASVAAEWGPPKNPTAEQVRLTQCGLGAGLWTGAEPRRGLR